MESVAKGGGEGRHWEISKGKGKEKYGRKM